MRDNNKENNGEIIFGINSVIAALEAEKSIERVFIANDLKNQRLFYILKECRKRRLSVSNITKKSMDYKISENHQGVFAVVSAKEYAPLEDILKKTEDEQALLIIPEGVEDPQNLGAIIRTAHCAGSQGIILPSNCSAGLSYGTSRASAGAVEFIDIARVRSMPDTLKTIKEKGIKLIGIEADAETCIWDADLSGPVAIVLGGEDKGIRPHILRELDQTVNIPITGNINSLNVSAAAATSIFEAVRQRNKK